VSVGKSSLGAMQIYMDEVSGKLNQDERGKYLGAFDTGSKLLSIYKDGSYEVNELDLNKKYDVNNIVEIGNYTETTVISAVYYEGEKGWTMVKRFKIETSTYDQKFIFIPESGGSKLYFASMQKSPLIRCSYNVGKTKEEKEVSLAEFIDVKGWKALGNKLIDAKLLKVEKLISEQPEDDSIQENMSDAVNESFIDDNNAENNPAPKIIPDLKLPSENDKPTDKTDKPKEGDKDKPGYKPGDTIEFDF
jgi:topoisomerase-4 subunit A